MRRGTPGGRRRGPRGRARRPANRPREPSSSARLLWGPTEKHRPPGGPMREGERRGGPAGARARRRRHRQGGNRRTAIAPTVRECPQRAHYSRTTSDVISLPDCACGHGAQPLRRWMVNVRTLESGTALQGGTGRRGVNRADNLRRLRQMLYGGILATQQRVRKPRPRPFALRPRRLTLGPGLSATQPSAWRARSRARALLSVSSYSAAGTESATTPAPACTWARSPAATTVRMAIARSIACPPCAR